MSDDSNESGDNTPSPESGTGPQVINPMQFLDLQQESVDPSRDDRVFNIKEDK